MKSWQHDLCLCPCTFGQVQLRNKTGVSATSHKRSGPFVTHVCRLTSLRSRSTTWLTPGGQHCQSNPSQAASPIIICTSSVCVYCRSRKGTPQLGLFLPSASLVLRYALARSELAVTRISFAPGCSTDRYFPQDGTCLEIQLVRKQDGAGCCRKSERG